MIIGTRAVTSWMSVEAFQRATGSKELHWIDGASHVDLYDKERYVGPSVEKLTAFFTENLGKTATLSVVVGSGEAPNKCPSLAISAGTC